LKATAGRTFGTEKRRNKRRTTRAKPDGRIIDRRSGKITIARVCTVDRAPNRFVTDGEIKHPSINERGTNVSNRSRGRRTTVRGRRSCRFEWGRVRCSTKPKTRWKVPRGKIRRNNYSRLKKTLSGHAKRVGRYTDMVTLEIANIVSGWNDIVSFVCAAIGLTSLPAEIVDVTKKKFTELRYPRECRRFKRKNPRNALSIMFFSSYFTFACITAQTRWSAFRVFTFRAIRLTTISSSQISKHFFLRRPSSSIHFCFDYVRNFQRTLVTEFNWPPDKM